MHSSTHHRFWRALPWLGALLMFWAASTAFAQDAADPPGRVGFLTHRQGSVVFAPEGEDEWVELPANRPITGGDRMWSDRDARAELQLGSATLHVDGQSHLGVSTLDDRAAQFILQQGSVNARVRELAQGENFEIGTPNVAVRALQPGDYRVDVDPQAQQTRVSVQSGLAEVFGENGRSVRIGAGQQANFAGRSLAQVNGPAYGSDDFAQWAAERNRAEDESLAARYVPRGVVGSSQLDQHGTWNQDPTYGAVWYPRIAVQDWAPYRYGHWEWIQPWGWTWMDDAPWGFAPFHYGRWTMIGSRWAWVPGRFATRPVYSPALVVFLGGGGTQFSLGVNSGPAVGWYPLAPGEAWWPVYRTSPRYVNYANFNINLNAYPRQYTNHVWRTRPVGVTAVREDDFRRGRPVYRHWQPLQPQVIGHAQVGVVPVRPEPRRHREGDAMPRLLGAPPATVQPAVPQRFFGGREAAPAVREQYRAQHEQDRLQRDAERAARAQMREQEQARRQQDVGWQRAEVYRHQQEIRLQQERAQREAVQQQQQQRQLQQLQQQRQLQEQAQRQQQHDMQRQQQHEMQRQQQEAQRQQQHELQRQQREAWYLRRQQQQAPQVAPQQVQPVMQQQRQVQQQSAPLVRAEAPRAAEVRAEGRWQRDGDDGRGRGHGRGHRD
jgi:hypothetical protein